jgi:DUF2934 family protein
MENLENRIRQRAYEIWTAHGCINGQADQHWLAAEREILIAVKQNLQQKGRVSVATTRNSQSRSSMT